MVRVAALTSALAAIALLSLGPAPTAAAADNSPRFVFEKRQASASASASHHKHHHHHSSSSAADTADTAGAGAGAGAGSSTAPPAQPTAAPAVAAGPIPASVLQILSTITSGTGNPQATQTLSKTYAAGAKNTYIPNAAGLPDISSLDPSQYPELDTLPSKSTRASVLAQNKKWLSGVDFSLVPNIPPSKDGSCASDPELAAQAQQNGWWTCGLYTRPTDITTCPQEGQWGLSYDDGPSPDTPQLLNYLDQHSLKATFFVVGSRVISRPDMARYESESGHQLSVHTWSHPSLTTLSNEDVYLELRWTMQIIKDVIGLTPNTMRPPYGDIDDRIRAICKLLNLTPVIWTSVGENSFDTDDWQIAGGGTTAVQVYTNFNNILSTAPGLSTGFIVLEHDLYQQSVQLATEVILPQALAFTPKLNLLPVVQCLNKPLGDAYVETNRNISGLGPAATALGNNAVYPSGTAPASSSGGGGGKSGNGGFSASYAGGAATDFRAVTALSLTVGVAASLGAVLVAM
ncbi:chitin deacetylase [Tilletia horrida]|nr:chitin deacetylase [Tilletia horrida]